MADTLSHWETIYRRFEPTEPAPPEWRVPRQPWSGGHKRDPFEVILRGLQRSFGNKKFVLLGTSGSGKTTELYGLADALAATHFTVLLDLQRHFQSRDGSLYALQHLQPWEVLLLAGLGILRGAQERLGVAFEAGLLTRLGKAAAAFLYEDAQASRATIDVGRLAKGVMVTVAAAIGASAGGPAGAVAAGGTASWLLQPLGTASEALKWDFRLGQPRNERRAIADVDQKAEELLGAINTLIRAVEEDIHRPLVVMIDGLDRIENSETIRLLFAESPFLGQLACPTVLTGPVLMRRDVMSVPMNNFVTEILTELPVLDHTHPLDSEAEGPGVGFFVEVFRSRTAGLAAQGISEPLLRRLGRMSGGRLRDFMNLVQKAAALAVDSGQPAATAALIEEVIEEERYKRERLLTREDVDLLRTIIADPEHRRPDSERAVKLLRSFFLLPYPNESEWYFPHPLLTLKLLRGSAA